MPSAVPKVLKNFNVIIDGYGYAGIADEVTPPALMLKTEDHRGGGLDIPIRLDMGMEVMELKFTMAEHSVALFRQFGLRDGRGVAITFRAAASDDKVVVPYVITCRGSYKDLTPSAIRAGDKNTISGTVSLRYYRLSINGVDIIEIDIDNMTRVIDGVDQLAEQRAAISL